MKTEMKVSKGLIAAWIISICVTVIFFGLTAYEWISGVAFPDAAKRISGIVELIAIAAVAFTSVRIGMIRKEQGTV